ncbi:MAG: hypothetical protein JXB48_20590 [Candidatus Latescibacteria bacterium]|nr:hypothetical protein [Candidatus Latescibacterota bacterium]
MYTLDCWQKRVEFDPHKHYGFVTVTAPARFDFIGGWTDTPPYYFDNVGCVLNTSLQLIECGKQQTLRNDDVWIKITISSAKEFSVTENSCRLTHPEQNLIISKTLEFLQLYRPGISIEITNQIPKGSGLGGSSLLVASILAGLWGFFLGAGFIREHLNGLINNVLLIEQLMESGGGWQDQIGGLFPGLKLIETTPEKPCNYSISYLESTCEQLSSTSLIIDTRIQRKAVKILNSIRQKYINRDRKVLEMLKTIAVNAKLGFTLLERNDIESFASLLSESWEMVNEIESGIVEPVNVLKNICGNDLIGHKIGGAGGGGFALAIFEDIEKKEYYRKKIQNSLKNCLMYDPVFCETGLTIIQDNSLCRPDAQIVCIDKIENV